MFQHPVQQSLQRTSPQKKKKHLIISGKRDQASFNATEGDLQDVVPQIVKDQNVLMTEADNPELKDENKKDKPFSLKIKIAGGLAVLILMTILVGFLIVYLSALMNLKQTQTIKIIMEDNSQSKRTQVQGIQYQWKDEDGYQETAVFSTTTNKQVQNGGRKLQDKSSIGSTILLPKQMENTFTSISIFCSLTQISVTLTSQSNDAQIFVPINRLIGLLLKYQKRNSIYTRKNFYYDVNKIKKVIQDEKKHSRVTIEQIYERQYNQASKLFQSVTSTNKRTETKRLIQSEQIPRIDNIQSLQAVSLAIREIISVVLSNAGRQFKQLLSTMPSDKKQMLALKSNVYYSPLRDQPSDVQKLCVPMNLNPYVLRCSKSLWNSQALPLSSSSASQQSSPAILISTII